MLYLSFNEDRCYLLAPQRYQTPDWRSLPSSHQWSRREDGAVFQAVTEEVQAAATTSTTGVPDAVSPYTTQYWFSPSQLLNGRQLRTKRDALLQSPAHIAQKHQAREGTKSQQKEQTAVQHVRTAYDVGTPATLCTVVSVKPVHQDGFRLQSPESMALVDSPSRCIPEDHYGNVTWNNFNLATELPRIPTPVSSIVNNPHQLKESQNIRRLKPCHHLLRRKHPTMPCLSMEDITFGGHHARRSLDSCIMFHEHF